MSVRGLGSHMGCCAVHLSRTGCLLSLLGKLPRQQLGWTCIGGALLRMLTPWCQNICVSDARHPEERLSLGGVSSCPRNQSAGPGSHEEQLGWVVGEPGDSAYPPGYSTSSGCSQCAQSFAGWRASHGSLSSMLLWRQLTPALGLPDTGSLCPWGPLFSSTRAPPPEGMDMAPLQSLSLQPHRPGHTPAHSDWGCHPLASRMANALIPERAHLSGQVYTRPCCDVPILSTSVARLPHPQFWGACHPETFMLGEQSR